MRSTLSTLTKHTMGRVRRRTSTKQRSMTLVVPDRGNPSTVMHVLKRRFAHRVLQAWRKRNRATQGRLWEEGMQAGHVWQRRFYDFVVFTERKRIEKLRYMHRNPVKRGLVLEADQWAWSSFRYNAYGEGGKVLVNDQKTAQMTVRTLPAKVAG
jgi:hypothetical protein